MSRKPNKYRKIGQAALLGSFIGAGPAGFAAWSLGLTDSRGKMGALLKQESLRLGIDVSEDGFFSLICALRIVGPSKLAILRTLTLLCRFKPFHWRVQDPQGVFFSM